MNEKEWLQEIKRKAMTFNQELREIDLEEHIDWLIEQAEKVEQLQQENEKEQKRLKNQIYKTVEEKFLLEKQVQQAQQEIERLVKQRDELELETNDWRAEVQKWQKFYEKSEESHLETKELLNSIVNQNKRYRVALKEIVDSLGWREIKAEEIAKKALEGE